MSNEPRGLLRIVKDNLTICRDAAMNIASDPNVNDTTAQLADIIQKSADNALKLLDVVL